MSTYSIVFNITHNDSEHIILSFRGIWYQATMTGLVVGMNSDASAKSACTAEGSRGLRRSWSTMEHLQNIRPSGSCMLVSCVSRDVLSSLEHSGGFRSSTIFMKLTSSQCSGVLWSCSNWGCMASHTCDKQ